MVVHGITEWHGAEPVKRHHVTIDNSVVGGVYRQLVSMQGFQTRMLNHTQRWDGERFVGYRNMELRFQVTGRVEDTKHNWGVDDVQVVEHANLWDFYKSIEYDHQRSRLRGKALQTKRR